MRGYWYFKLRIESKKLIYTKDMVKEIQRLLKSSDAISHYEIKEVYE